MSSVLWGVEAKSALPPPHRHNERHTGPGPMPARSPLHIAQQRPRNMTGIHIGSEYSCACDRAPEREPGPFMAPLIRRVPSRRRPRTPAEENSHRRVEVIRRTSKVGYHPFQGYPLRRMGLESKAAAEARCNREEQGKSYKLNEGVATQCMIPGFYNPTLRPTYDRPKSWSRAILHDLVAERPSSDVEPERSRDCRSGGSPTLGIQWDLGGEKQTPKTVIVSKRHLGGNTDSGSDVVGGLSGRNMLDERGTGTRREEGLLTGSGGEVSKRYLHVNLSPRLALSATSLSASASVSTSRSTSRFTARSAAVSSSVTLLQGRSKSKQTLPDILATPRQYTGFTVKSYRNPNPATIMAVFPSSARGHNERPYSTVWGSSLIHNSPQTYILPPPYTAGTSHAKLSSSLTKVRLSNSRAQDHDKAGGDHNLQMHETADKKIEQDQDPPPKEKTSQDAAPQQDEQTSRGTDEQDKQDKEAESLGGKEQESNENEPELGELKENEKIPENSQDLSQVLIQGEQDRERVEEPEPQQESEPTEEQEPQQETEPQQESEPTEEQEPRQETEPQPETKEPEPTKEQKPPQEETELPEEPTKEPEPSQELPQEHGEKEPDNSEEVTVTPPTVLIHPPQLQSAQVTPQ